MKKSDCVSVILPCYNERGNIIALIEAIHQELLFCEHEIIVVDDNSPDGTFDLVKNKNYDFVKVILRTVDNGFAKSIRKGIEDASGNLFVIMDSDFNHQPRYLHQLVVNLEFYDSVYGSRFVYGGGMNSFWRNAFSWIFNLFVRIVTFKYVTDSLYGYVAIRREVIEKLDYDKIFWGKGDYCIRMTYYLQKQKSSILQIPALNGERLAGRGNKNFFKTLLLYTKETLKLVFLNR